MEFIKNILESWGLKNLVNVFKCAKVDSKEKFLKLSVDDIDKIIPDINGVRDNFKNNFFTFLMLESNFETEETATENLQDLPKSTEETSSSFSNENDPNFINASNPYKKSKKRSLDQLVDTEEESDEDELIGCKINIKNIENIDKYYTQVQRNTSLYKYLAQDEWGKIILFAYGKQKILRRRMLCDILMKKALVESMNSDKPFLFSTDNHISMRNSITELFTTESETLLFQKSEFTKTVQGKKKDK